MPYVVRGLLSVLGRILLCAIFAMSAANEIVHFDATVKDQVIPHQVPWPPYALLAAIVFTIVGSLLIILGFKARVGALLLLVFLVLATYYFHAFWKEADPQAHQQMMIDFMKNVGLMGAMLFLIANGSGAMSLDDRCCNPKPKPAA